MCIILKGKFCQERSQTWLVTKFSLSPVFSRRNTEHTTFSRFLVCSTSTFFHRGKKNNRTFSRERVMVMLAEITGQAVVLQIGYGTRRRKLSPFIWKELDERLVSSLIVFFSVLFTLTMTSIIYTTQFLLLENPRYLFIFPSKKFIRFLVCMLYYISI